MKVVGAILEVIRVKRPQFKMIWYRERQPSGGEKSVVRGELDWLFCVYDEDITFE